MPAKTRPEHRDESTAAANAVEVSAWAAARHYAQRGWFIFPLLPGKKTFKVRWREAATCKVERIDKWFADVEPPPNVGIACGESGLLVIDLDIKESVDGREAWERLKQNHDFSDEGAFLAQTPSGGRHVVFTDPTEGDIRNSIGLLAPGIDVRANGGYIVAVPSLHPDYPDGPPYRWLHYREQTPPMSAPAALVELLTARPPRAKSKTTPPSRVDSSMPDSLAATIPEGRRNSELTRFGGQLRHLGMTFEEIREALLTANAHRCKPPLPVGDVRVIARSVSDYPAGPVRIDRRIIRPEIGNGMVLLAALLAAGVAEEDIPSVANVTAGTVNRWWLQLREAELEEVTMTRPRQRYCTVPRGLLHDRELTTGAKVTGITLALYMRNDVARVSLEQLLKRRGMTSRDKLSVHIRALEDAGHLLVSRTAYCGSKGHRHRPNEYRWRDTIPAR